MTRCFYNGTRNIFRRRTSTKLSPFGLKFIRNVTAHFFQDSGQSLSRKILRKDSKFLHEGSCAIRSNPPVYYLSEPSWERVFKNIYTSALGEPRRFVYTRYFLTIVRTILDVVRCPLLWSEIYVHQQWRTPWERTGVLRKGRTFNVPQRESSHFKPSFRPIGTS